jgi:hypothetical protein
MTGYEILALRFEFYWEIVWANREVNPNGLGPTDNFISAYCAGGEL